MYYNPSYMNPIMKGLNQGQPQQPNQEPLEGIASLAPQTPQMTQPMQPLSPQMTPPPGGIQSITQPPTQNTGFNFDPSGGSLMSQLATAYGGQTHNEQIGRGPAGFTQGFADFFTGEGYYADPRPTYTDAGWSISDKPIQYGGGTKGGGTFDPYGNPQGSLGQWAQQQGISQTDANWHQPQQQIELANTRANDMQQPLQQGAGIMGLANYQSQQNTGPGI